MEHRIEHQKVTLAILVVLITDNGDGVTRLLQIDGREVRLDDFGTPLSLLLRSAFFEVRLHVVQELLVSLASLGAIAEDPKAMVNPKTTK